MGNFDEQNRGISVSAVTEGRRYLGLDILAKSRLRLLPDTGPEEVTDSILELSA